MMSENTSEMIGIPSWTKEEEQYLLENSEKPLKEIAEELKRSIQAIKDKRRSLGLKREKIRNLQGKRFGRLLVLRENGRKGRKVAWLCKCECGKEKTISSTHLIQGDTVSCGCYSREISAENNSNNLSGQRFNHLLAIKKVGKSNTLNTWLCLCDCGKYTIVISKNLIRGNTESCGCRRNIIQRKGMNWELLVKNVLKYKFPDFFYHKRLPNNSVPDFTVETQNIILDAKRHDYLNIEECIDKYSPFCEKLIFVCMEKKRKNWKIDFKDSNRIEFWYNKDILNWIPHEEKELFSNALKEIANLWIKEKDTIKKLKIEKTILELEKEEKKITQKTIAKKLGVSKNSNIAFCLEKY